MADNNSIMRVENEQIRYKNVLGAKLLKESGFYDEILEDIIDVILSGKTRNAKDFLDELGLNNKQIEQFQKETRSRASWSFYTALIAMFCGFGFIFWGGYYILATPVAGTAVAGIGGAISAFITKTFLGIHRLSLQQLDHYFKKTLINTYVLMAEHLANNIPNSPVRQKSYKAIIQSLLSLIENESNNGQFASTT